jgi:hypothetical protein
VETKVSEQQHMVDVKTQQKDERKDIIVPVIVPRRGMQGQGDDLCAPVVRIYFVSCVFQVPCYHLQAAPDHIQVLSVLLTQHYTILLQFSLFSHFLLRKK